MQRSAAVFVVCLVLLAAGTQRAAFGQAFFQMGQQSVAGRLIEPPRAILQLLRDAERAAAQRRYSEAVVMLGELLQRQPASDDDDELSGQDFFIVNPEAIAGRSPAPVHTTLFGEARRLLSSMPAAAIETYELRYGPEARDLLERSAQRRDWTSVAEVRRRFFHTEAGRDATAMLAQRAVARGQGVEAIRLLEALQTHPKLDRSARGGVQVMLAGMRHSALQGAPTSLDDAGAAAAPADAASSADAPAPQGIDPSGGAANQAAPQQVVLGGETLSPPQGDAFDRWLEQRFGDSRRRTKLPSANVTMLGNDPSRSESSQGQMPLSIPRWIARAAATPSQERLLEEAAEAMVSLGDVAPPAWVPLRVGDQVLMRSTERLYGLDFQTGKLVWQYPWFDSSEKTEVSDLAALLEEESGHTLLKQRVWNDLPYGRITSDGQRVFVLADLAEVEATSLSPLMGFQGTRPADATSNSLVALDLATEGKLLWRLGGRNDQASGWAETFFLGPPLPLDDALYVMAEVTGDIVLICLDAATGLERWRQQLLAVESGGIGTDPIRRVAGATPSYHEGILVCSTGAGAVIGFDLLDQSFVWALTVERNEALNQNAYGSRDGFSPDRLLKRWWDGTPKIVGDTVYVTPIESDRLFALDLLTGKRRWNELARSQTGSRYLAGVRDGTIVLVGGDHVRGFSAKTGKPTWKTNSGWLDAGEQVSGVGVFGTFTESLGGRKHPCYFVPTSSNRIIAVSTEDGTALSHRATQYRTGNLIAAGGQILSQSPTTLSVAYGQQTLEPTVAQALAANPDDFFAVVRQAELLMERGELSEALQWLSRAREMNPEDIDVENLSVRAMLSALREDFSGNIDLLPQLDRLIYQASDRVELIKLQVRAAITRGQPQQAASRLVELSRMIAKDPALAAITRSSGNDSSRQVSLDSWLAARVAEAISASEPAEQTAINDLVSEHLQRYGGASTPIAKRLLVHFGSLPGAETLSQMLLDRFRDEEAYLAMERLVLGVAAATPETPERLSPWQLTALAEAYARGGLQLDAAALMQRLGDAKDIDQWAQSLGLSAEQVRSITAAAEPLAWGDHVTVRLSQENVRGRPLARRPAVGETRRVVGRSFRGWQLVSDESSPFAVRDPLGTLHAIPLDGLNRRDDMSRQAVFSGGLMIAVLPGELVGVNLFEVLRGQLDPVIWRRPWRTDSSSSGGGIRKSEATSFGDQVYRYVGSSGGATPPVELQLGPIIGDTFYVLQGGELIAYDTMTAEPRWRNLETPRGGTIVCDAEVVAILSPASQRIVKYDCRDGRRLGEETFEGYRVWSSSDELVLVYRDTPEGTRDLVLLSPITGKEYLRHTFQDVLTTNRVFGRVVDGRYAVTLGARGDVLIWDLHRAEVLGEVKLPELPTLRGLHVLGRNDSLVLLPNTADAADERAGVALHAASGQDHVRVDAAVTAISNTDGKILWRRDLESEPWGCTLTQSPISPLLMLSRSKSRYETTGSRTKTLDLMAIDTRDGSATTTLDRRVESYNNDIETRLVLQPPQQRVIVNVGTLTLDYEFSDAEPGAEQRGQE